MALTLKIAKAIDAHHAKHPELTVGEIIAALENICRELMLAARR